MNDKFIRPLYLGEMVAAMRQKISRFNRVNFEGCSYVCTYTQTFNDDLYTFIEIVW